ncbi:hypothetical protein GPALN_009774, partial [Globodera pallida]
EKRKKTGVTSGEPITGRGLNAMKIPLSRLESEPGGRRKEGRANNQSLYQRQKGEKVNREGDWTKGKEGWIKRDQGSAKEKQ